MNYVVGREEEAGGMIDLLFKKNEFFECSEFVCSVDTSSANRFQIGITSK